MVDFFAAGIASLKPSRTRQGLANAVHALPRADGPGHHSRRHTCLRTAKDSLTACAWLQNVVAQTASFASAAAHRLRCSACASHRHLTHIQPQTRSVAQCTCGATKWTSPCSTTTLYATTLPEAGTARSTAVRGTKTMCATQSGTPTLATSPVRWPLLYRAAQHASRSPWACPRNCTGSSFRWLLASGAVTAAELGKLRARAAGALQLA